MIFASSGNAIRGFERVPPYSDIAAGNYDKVPPDFRKLTHHDVRPEALYGAAKVWGEALARHFSDDYDMSMICVRIGSVTQGNRPRTMRENAIYLSHNDVATHLKACIDAPDELRFDTFFAVSNNKWNYRDLTHPKKCLAGNHEILRTITRSPDDIRGCVDVFRHSCEYGKPEGLAARQSRSVRRSQCC